MSSRNHRSIRQRLRKIVRQSRLPVIDRKYDVSDVVQVCFLQLWSDLKTQQQVNNDRDGSEIVTAWLRKIVMGNLANLFRRANAQKRDIKREFANNEDLHPGSSRPPVELAEKREQVLLLSEQLQGLPEFQRQVTLMYFFEERSYDEIADRLNTNRYQVQKAYQDALLKLKMRLSQ